MVVFLRLVLYFILTVVCISTRESSLHTFVQRLSVVFSEWTARGLRFTKGSGEARRLLVVCWD